MSEVQCPSCREGQTKEIKRGKVAVPDHDKPVANPLIVLREEFDDWAILFDPDTGNSFGLNPTGVYLWKGLDGEHSIDDMLKALRGDAHDVPKDTSDHIRPFDDALVGEGLAGFDPLGAAFLTMLIGQSCTRKIVFMPPWGVGEMKKFTYVQDRGQVCF